MSGSLRPGTKHRIVFAVLSAAAALVLLHSAYRWSEGAKTGWTGLTVELQASLRWASDTYEHALVITFVEPRSPASRAGLSAGERVLAIDGSRENLLQRARRLIPQREAVFTVRGAELPDARERGAEERAPEERAAVLTPVAPLSQPTVLVRIAVNTVLGCIAFLIGAFVLRKRPEDTRAAMFFVCTSLYAITRFFRAGPIHLVGLDLGSSLVPLIVWLICAALFFAALLHFCLIFPRRRPVLERYPSLLPSIYTLVSLVILAVASFLVWISRTQVSDQAAADAVRWVHRWFLASAEPTATAIGVALLVLGVVWAAAIPGLVHAWREDGWRGAFLGAPIRLIAAVIALPLTASALFRAALFLLPVAEGLKTASLLMLGAGVAVSLIGIGATIMVVLPVAAATAMIRSYRTATGVEKRQLRWPMWGITVAVAGSLLCRPLLAAMIGVTAAGADTRSRLAMTIAAEHLPSVLLTLIPVSFAVAVLRYRLMDIDFYVRGISIYGGASLLLGLTYIVLVGGLGSILARAFNLSGEIVPMASTLALAALFIPVRNRMQEVVDRRFYRRADYPAALTRLHFLLSSARSRAEIARIIVDVVEHAAHVRYAAIWLPAEGTGALMCIAGSDDPSELAGSPRDYESDRLGAGSALVLPLGSGDRTSGVLTVGEKLSASGFDRQDQVFLEFVCAQAATALANVNIEEQRSEFDKAREIQDALLPKALPQPDRISAAGSWQPSRIVGGDYYDLIRLDDTHFALAIADVSGKGVPAALLMSNLQAAAKLLAVDGIPPARLCSRLNHMVCRNVAPGRFITFFYGVLDAERMHLAFTNAGHNPPLLVRSDGTVERLDCGGTVLGFFPDAVYAEAAVTLRGGDRLVLYTDGLSEAGASGEDEFGEERIVSVVRECADERASVLCEKLVASATQHCKGQFEDDMTVLVLCAAAAGKSAAAASPGLP